MVVAQLVKQALLTPEVRVFNRVIGKLDITYMLSTILKWGGIVCMSEHTVNGLWFHITKERGLKLQVNN